MAAAKATGCDALHPAMALSWKIVAGAALREEDREVGPSPSTRSVRRQAKAIALARGCGVLLSKAQLVRHAGEQKRSSRRSVPMPL